MIECCPMSVPSVLVNPLLLKKVIHYAQSVGGTELFPFLLMLESPCSLIIFFHVLSSVPTCALKSPSRIINSADVTFCKATPSSFKKGWYCASVFGA